MPFSIAWVVIIAAIGVAANLLAAPVTLGTGFDFKSSLIFAAIISIPGIPVAYGLSLLRVGKFGRQHGLPSRTYLIPRWLVRLSGSSLLGNIAALFVLSAIQETVPWYFAICLVPITLAFLMGGYRRLKRSPASEFNVPFRRLLFHGRR